MNDIAERRAESAATAAREWGRSSLLADGEHVLERVLAEAAGPGEVPERTIRRGPLLLAGAAAVLVAGGGLALLTIDPDGDDERIGSSVVDTGTTTVSLPETTVSEEVPEPELELEPDVATFVVDPSALDLQETFPVIESELGNGSGDEQLGGEPCIGCDSPRPTASALAGDSFVVADRVNARVVVVDPYQLQYRSEEFAGAVEGDDPIGPPDPFVTLPIDAPGDVASIGAPIVSPSGQEIFVPVAAMGADGATVTTIQRFVPTDPYPEWELVEVVTAGVDAPSFDVADAFRIEGGSVVRVPANAAVDADAEAIVEVGPYEPFLPIVRETDDGLVVTDSAGSETRWSVGFTGTPSGLPDGSVVVVGDGETPQLLRLWPDGTAASSRYGEDGSFDRRPRAQGTGVASIVGAGDGWVLQRWPLPARAQDPITEPGEAFETCTDFQQPERMSFDGVDSVMLPWTVVGGPIGDNGLYYGIDDGLGRRVTGAGCASGGPPQDPVAAQGYSYFRIGDSQYVLVVEPTSLGGVTEQPDWLGEPIARNEIVGLDAEGVVYEVPDDRALPAGTTPRETVLIVSLEGGRRTRISSAGIGVYFPPPDEVATGADPLEPPLDGAVAFVQGYLDALAEGRWADAVTYIENNGRNWADRPAFADLFALVGEDVGSPEALERWCSEERRCDRGTANGVLEPIDEARVRVAVTFDVPGGPTFEQTINPQWVVGVSEGRLYVDGLPQVMPPET